MQHEFIQLTFNQFFLADSHFFISERRKNYLKNARFFCSLDFFETPPFIFHRVPPREGEKNVFFNIIIFLHNFTLTYTAISVEEKKNAILAMHFFPASNLLCTLFTYKVHSSYVC
jgi:hypothetical protein